MLINSPRKSLILDEYIANPKVEAIKKINRSIIYSCSIQWFLSLSSFLIINNSGVYLSPKTKYPKNAIRQNKTHSKVKDILAAFFNLLKVGTASSFLKENTKG